METGSGGAGGTLRCPTLTMSPLIHLGKVKIFRPDQYSPKNTRVLAGNGSKLKGKMGAFCWQLCPPEIENTKSRPESENTKFLPESGNTKFSLESGNTKYGPTYQIKSQCFLPQICPVSPSGSLEFVADLQKRADPSVLIFPSWC